MRSRNLRLSIHYPDPPRARRRANLHSGTHQENVSRKKGLDRSKMVAFSNYFFDTTQGHSQINGCTVKNTYTKEAFDTGIKYDFKGNFDLEKLEAGIKEVGAENVPYIVCTITCNSAGGQPVSIANLRGMYAIAQKYDIPVVMDSARFAENAYFIQQREPGYQNKSIEEITREKLSIRRYTRHVCEERRDGANGWFALH